MRALVVGGDGGIGRALRARLRGQHEVSWTTRRDLREAEVFEGEECGRCDLRDMELPWGFDVHKTREVGRATDVVVYLIAAITGAIRCERDPDAWLVNAEAPVALATQAKARGWHAVFLTSGAPEVAPHTALAMQKSYAGLAVLLLGGCVVRPVGPVPPERYVEFADLLVRVGAEGRTGLVRWEG